MKTIIVSRHPALVEYIRVVFGTFNDEIKNAEVLPHVESVDQIRGHHVIGVLPIHLAVHCGMVTEIPLSLTPEDRGQELSFARLLEIACDARTYQVRELFDHFTPRLKFTERMRKVLRSTGLLRSYKSM